MKTNDLHIELPSSKSISNRWLVLNHIAGYPFVLRNLSTADDTQLLQALLSQLRRGTSTHFHCHNAGTVARFLLALLAVTPGRWTLGGDERLQRRPFAPLIDTLRSMGCNIQCTGQEGFLPVQIEGYIPQRKMAEIDPSASSQFVSAMLLIGPLLPQGLTLTLTERPASRPYIDMTMAVLRNFGIRIVGVGNDKYHIPAKQKYRPHPVKVEGDWSSAAYLQALNFLGGNVRLLGLDPLSPQGDKAFDSYLKGMRGKKPTLNISDTPDLGPILMAVAAAGHGVTLEGTHRLQYKESDRGAVMAKELEKFGIQAVVDENRIWVEDGVLRTPTEPLDSHGDHRIAMALAVLFKNISDNRVHVHDPS